MAVIEKRVRIQGSKGEEELEALFDSGATYSCIKPELANKFLLYASVFTRFRKKPKQRKNAEKN